MITPTPYFLITMSHLGLTYQKLGKWEEAAKLQEDVVKLHQEKKTGAGGGGDDDPADILPCLQDLETTYRDQGNWEQAERVAQDILRLAQTYQVQGRFSEAGDLLSQALEIQVKVLGEEHRETLFTKNNLACTWHGQGRHQDAAEMMKECVAGLQRVFGHEHDVAIECQQRLETCWQISLKLGQTPTRRRRWTCAISRMLWG